MLFSITRILSCLVGVLFCVTLTDFSAHAESPPQPDQAPSASPISLEEPLDVGGAVGYALSNNPHIRAKQKELGIADGALQQASRYFQNNPILSGWIARRSVPGSTERGRSVSASLGPLSTPSFSASAEASFSRIDSEDHTDFNIGLSQKFEVFGQPLARRRSANAYREAVLAEIADVAWDVMLETRLAYYAAQVAERRAQLLNEQHASVEAIRALLQRRFEHGDIARTEYRQLEIQSAQLSNELLLARADARGARVDLNDALGLEPDTEVTLAPELLELVRPPSSSEEWVEMHPRLQYGRLLTEQRRQEADLTRREAKPDITGSIFWTREETDSDIVGIGISVPIPFFNRGQGMIAAARARIEAAEAEAVATRKHLRGHARDVLQHYTATYEAAKVYREDILPMTEKNLAAVENAFRLGDISMVDLRLSQRELLDTQASALDTLEKHYRWRAELEGLIGHGLDEAPREEKESTS